MSPPSGADVDVRAEVAAHLAAVEESRARAASHREEAEKVAARVASVTRRTSRAELFRSAAKDLSALSSFSSRRPSVSSASVSNIEQEQEQRKHDEDALDHLWSEAPEETERHGNPLFADTTPSTPYTPAFATPAADVLPSSKAATDGTSIPTSRRRGGYTLFEGGQQQAPKEKDRPTTARRTSRYSLL